MGFRSTLVTTEDQVPWPDWFRAQYAESLSISRWGKLSSQGERKVYGEWVTLAEDIQKAIVWDKFERRNRLFQLVPRFFVLIFLHECGGLTRVQIGRDRILWSEPTEWRQVTGVTHSENDGSDCRNQLPLLLSIAELASIERFGIHVST